MKYKQIQEQVNMIDKALFEELNIAVISNISFEPYFDPIVKQAFSSDHITPIIMPIRYEEYQSAESCLKLERADVIIIILNFEFMFSNLFNDIYSREKDVKTVIADVVSLCENLYYFVLNCSTSQILWFGFEDYYCKEYITKGNVTICQNLIDKLNAHIYEFINKDTTFVDLKRLIANVGISNAYHNKAKYRWHSPYSQQLISEVANEIHKQYLIEKGVTKKCIVLDCDNVLWGGILLEDGIENIKLGGIGTGRVYQDFQSFLLSIYYHGVILAVCSKNDLMDVMTTFREHNEMILKEEHISYFKVNWDNKAENIKKISECLNIGLESMVFIDDTPFEIQTVKNMLPDVMTILYNRDTVYEQLSCFNLKSDIDIENIQHRNNTFKSNQLRESLKCEFSDYNEYLKALEMRVVIKESSPVEYSRISELSQRTNKFTNGKRYTVADIKEKAAFGCYKLYSVSVSDKFSDLGLIGTIGIDCNTDGNILDLFCLSCRALGRNVENKMLQLVNEYKVKKFEFISTGKNSNIKTLFNDKIIIRQF